MTSSSNPLGGGSQAAAQPRRRRHRNRVVVPLLRRWHHRLGALLAALLLLVALTGTLLIYKDAILSHTIAAGVSAPTRYAPDELARDLDGIARRYAPREVSYLKAPSNDRSFWTVVDPAGSSSLLAPRTLEELNQFSWLLTFFDIVRALHVDLMLHTPGDVILLVLGVIIVFFAVSGLVMWWPARRHFRPERLVPRRFNRQHLLISHRQLGLLVAPLLVLSAVTGSVMLGNGLVRLLVTPPPAASAPVPEPVMEEGAALNPGQLFSAAQQALPEGQLTLAKLPQPTSTSVQFRMRLPGEWHPNGRTRVTVDTRTGEVQPIDRADRATSGQRLLNQMYPLHSAYGLHPLYRVLVFVGGAVTLWLTVSGFFSWVKRRRKAQAH